MKHPKLVSQKREITGKKVKKLRDKGILPANLYGKKIKSQSLQVATEEFVQIYKSVGNTGLVELGIQGTSKIHPVLIHNVHKHPVNDKLLHVDFHEVELKEKMKVEVPVRLEGQSPAIAQNIGILQQIVEKFEVEALPADLPEEITVDITGLAEIGQEIKVSDVKSNKSYVLLAEADQVIVKINPLQKEEEPEPAEKDDESNEYEKEVKPAGDNVEKTEDKKENDTKKPAEGNNQKDTPTEKDSK